MSQRLWEDEPGPSAPRAVTLVRLSAEIARSLVAIGRIVVEGEVYRPLTGRNGAVYFTLRDRVAQIDVRAPAAVARRGRVVAGERVAVAGALQWTTDRGQVQLVADEVTPVGAGAIAALIAETRARLARAGLLERPRRPIPVLPRAIGVVCGTEAAVRKDIESVMAARCPGYPVRFFETTVSGPGAAISIVEAISALARVAGVEVIILARGGGDAPSLLPWSSEEVCRAVASCPVPVVSAIGHDGDRPLCDEVADLRCGTPSLAATAVLPDVGELARTADAYLARGASGLSRAVEIGRRRLDAVDLRRAVSAGVDRSGQRLERAAIRLAGVHPAARLRAAEHQARALDWRRPFWEGFGRASGRLEADGRHLRALSPQRTLERGYAVVTGPGGKVVRSVAAVRAGQLIEARVADGRLSATVVATRPAGAGAGEAR